MVLTDTSRAAQAVRDEVLRGLSLEQRFQLTAELSEAAFSVARGGIARRHPHYTDRDVHLAFLRMLHGDDITQKLAPGEPLREF